MTRKRSPTDQAFTELQGQYLAFIDAYTTINDAAPAEADLQRYFKVTPPSVHQMVLTLERYAFISRVQGRHAQSDSSCLAKLFHDWNGRSTAESNAGEFSSIAI